jgi:hypothetical protein
MADVLQNTAAETIEAEASQGPNDPNPAEIQPTANELDSAFKSPLF